MADSLLSASVQSVLNNFHLVEGGYYFYTLDAFIGYGFPTINDPKPAFGPPPRSYNIIREQVRKSVEGEEVDRKSTRLNSSHVAISYAVFCLKNKTSHDNEQ